ncbi:MAG: SDR family oxidoreductase [Rikenellaceae bacterium]
MEKLTIITGGGSGLGIELARIISKEEAVCIVGRDGAKLDRAKANLEADGAKCIITRSADVANDVQVKELFLSLKEYHIHRVINCAGVGKFGNPEDITTEMVEELIGSNLLSVIYMSSTAIGYMKELGGSIVTILSTAAVKGTATESIYCASKWGARGYCESLKAAFKGSNIKILTVCPGGINTPFWSESCGRTPNVESFMKAEELADVIYYNIKDKDSLYCSDILIERL